MKKSLKDCFLYLCTEIFLPEESFVALLDNLTREYVDIVQIRSQKNDRAIIDCAKRAKLILEKNDALLAINNRVDIALASKADILHLGQNDMNASEARALLGEEISIGLSTHTLQEFKMASKDAAVNYISIGPIYKTATKPDYIPCGLSTLQEVSLYSTEKPFFAIGGIDLQNIDNVLRAGASRVAVVRAIVEAKENERSAKLLKQRIISHRA
jgi:thiamine-phosphate pyrophosphorylase